MPFPTGGTLRSCSRLTSTISWIGALVPWARRAPHLQGLLVFILLQFSNKKSDVFNILWVLVFGFATLNILSLVARRFEPQRNRLSFGETLAIGVVLMSVVLLAWELLTIWKIFPIKLHTG
jgi:hypothetical protein